MKFQERVWEMLKKIPEGKVTTYGEISHGLNTKAYRVVGIACHNNPYSPVAACHRVVNSDGSIGGFSSEVKKKIKMLEREGVKVRNGKIVDFEKILFRFSKR